MMSRQQEIEREERRARERGLNYKHARTTSNLGSSVSAKSDKSQQKNSLDGETVTKVMLAVALHAVNSH